MFDLHLRPFFRPVFVQHVALQGDRKVCVRERYCVRGVRDGVKVCELSGVCNSLTFYFLCM